VSCERSTGKPNEEQRLGGFIVAAVIAALTMSVDGFIAHEDDSVGHLFDWYGSGEVEVCWPGMGMISHVAPPSAAYLRDTIKRAGALVTGRRVYDYTNGWGGSHPLGVPLFLVTHRPPQEWPVPGAPFTAVPEGVAAAIEKARDAAGGKTVALVGPSIIQQALELDLVDEIAVDLAPVLLGKGISFFGEFAHPPGAARRPRGHGERVSPTSDSASATVEPREMTTSPAPQRELPASR
jgi:dihydrofolate reductase